MIWDSLIAPFVEFAFMRRALVGALAVAVASAPVGVFLMLRRMSLTGDALAHGILPGIAAAYLLAGLSLYAMTLGGLIAGLLIAGLAGLVSRVTVQREDASLASFHLVALAVGVLLVSMSGSQVDLIHVLFGSVLALDDGAVLLVAGVATVTLVTLALIYRLLVMECVDPSFLRAVAGPSGAWVHHIFLALVVLCLVAGFHAMGTLMAVGLMILPATLARFWARTLDRIILIAVCAASVSIVAGLLLSYHANLPSGPAIILAAGVLYLLSVVLGSHSGLKTRFTPRSHL
ncbi:MAG: metal ABC transporter permease [Rhodospirillaceae bacterium]|jgi:zinc/manganese transport system permease protein|nr:metal ABC transporter permease [Rhodospirillaceae bacterium]MBT6511295.1 metal ABC transporter permease [Rhodospirillaceae bacterium]MBT7615516.1 metal ABC transporter permease [Rhodospirillaceae bacterium]MBT7648504.1 metal ABC transporter permease [Rhodospirillaceae bacterium]